ncbi:hypothetical protein O181_072442, partial [Austropuccinia psidii MF-1]|nr:hypothetical protein [Austropuccinia psidii MF-1]
MSNPIQTTGDHSSSDDEGYQTKIIILTRDNWVQWSCQLENFRAGKGHESLLSPPSYSDKGTPQDQALLVDKQSQTDQSKPTNQTANCGKGKAPTRGQNKNRSNPNQKKDANSLKRLENLEKIVAKLELTGKNTNVNVVTEHSKELSGDIQQSDSDAYVVEDEVLRIGSGESDKIYLDSGAGQSVVNNLEYLTKVFKVNKKLNTYAEPVDISHQGTLISLLCTILLKEKLISWNLFASRIDSQTIFNINTPQLLKDWHTTLGHPSDTYTKKLIRDKKLIGGFTSSSECQVCLHAKIKRVPHLRHLPVTHSPFVKLHIDTLEISPPSRQGFCYVLVIVDDFSRFNRIFLMTKKSQIIPFGIKVVVENDNTASKVNAMGHSMKALTFEPFSDALRVLDPHTGKIRITRDYTQLKSETTVILQKNPSSLPRTINPPQPREVTLPTLSGQTSSTDVSRASQQVQNEPLPQVENHCPSPMPQTQTAVHKPRYDYVPYYKTTQFDISSNLDFQNILSGEKCQRHSPDRLMLADVITYKQALTNPEESKAWQSAMKQKYDSLINHNTGELVPYPSDVSKVIGGIYATHPTDKHWVALKHLLRYLKGSLDLYLHYFNCGNQRGLVRWADADYANDRSDQKSVSGNLITYHGNPVSWTSKKHSVVAQSTTEAEFISMNLCVKQLRWMTYLLTNLGQEVTNPAVFNDNLGAVTISNQASLNPNMKHIEIRYQY